MEKLLIIDGNNLLFQMFYGMPSKIYNKSGRTIHATIGFVSYLIKQIKLLEVNRVVVVFDSDSSQERKNEYSEYKQNRFIDWEKLPSDEIPFNEEEYIIRCLDYLNIKTIYSEGMEADDVIASITKLFCNEYKIYISSFDSDFFQLINDNVKVIRYRGKNTVIYDKEYFTLKFGFEPSKYVLYKSLVGDNSDNIKGVKGIGKVRATNIVKITSDIDNLNNLDFKMKELVLNSLDIIKRNIKLIELKHKNIGNMNINDFSFSMERASLTNSLILSACNIFD